MASGMNTLMVSVVIIGGLAWFQQDTLKAQWQKLYPPPAPVATQTTVYTWKDKDGTVHYSNTPDHQSATQTIIDTKKIARLEPIPEKQPDTPKDKLLITEVKEKMIQTRNKMQEAKEKQIMEGSEH